MNLILNKMELNKIYNTDCLEFMKTLPDKCIDLVLTDPPYGIGAYKNGTMGGGVLAKQSTFRPIDWDNAIPSKDIFDEINVQMIKDNFGDFKIVYEYTKNNLEKPISTLIDSILSPALLIQIKSYLSENNPNNTRWIYHRLRSYMNRFRVIKESMQEIEIDYYLTGCNKRYGGDTEFKDVDVTITCCHLKYIFITF